MIFMSFTILGLQLILYINWLLVTHKWSMTPTTWTIVGKLNVYRWCLVESYLFSGRLWWKDYREPSVNSKLTQISLCAYNVFEVVLVRQLTIMWSISVYSGRWWTETQPFANVYILCYIYCIVYSRFNRTHEIRHLFNNISSWREEMGYIYES